MGKGGDGGEGARAKGVCEGVSAPVANLIMAFRRALAPRTRSAWLVCSEWWCDTPLTDGTNIIAIGAAMLNLHNGHVVTDYHPRPATPISTSPRSSSRSPPHLLCIVRRAGVHESVSQVAVAPCRSHIVEHFAQAMHQAVVGGGSSHVRKQAFLATQAEVSGDGGDKLADLKRWMSD